MQQLAVAVLVIFDLKNKKSQISVDGNYGTYRTVLFVALFV
jgi:hypothetical protein